MQSFLDMLPAGYRESFGIGEIVQPEFLSSARATAFTWTKLPGRVCLALNREYFDEAAANSNVVAIVAPRQAITPGALPRQAVIVADKATDLFYALHNAAIHAPRAPASAVRELHPTARVAPDVRLLGGDIRIGAGSVVHEGCILIGPLEIGPDCTVMPGTLLGTDGMFSKEILGRKHHITHFGGVRLGRNCIVHAGSNISKSVNFGEVTDVADGVSIGIGVNIGHDCSIGADTDVSGRVMLAGRVTVGRDCWLGAGAILSNAITVGDGAKVRIGSIVIGDVPAGGDVSGNFAQDHNQRLRELAKARRR
ncbi:MAG TPA: hypothetical protein VF651_00605 [Gammaproteobacteria bacterium]